MQDDVNKKDCLLQEIKEILAKYDSCDKIGIRLYIRNCASNGNFYSI